MMEEQLRYDIAYTMKNRKTVLWSRRQAGSLLAALLRLDTLRRLQPNPAKKVIRDPPSELRALLSGKKVGSGVVVLPSPLQRKQISGEIPVKWSKKGPQKIDVGVGVQEKGKEKEKEKEKVKEHGGSAASLPSSPAPSPPQSPSNSAIIRRGWWSKWEHLHEVFLICSKRGSFLCGHSNGSAKPGQICRDAVFVLAELQPGRVKQIHAAEKKELREEPGRYFSLQSCHGLYLSAEEGGTVQVKRATLTVCCLWELIGSGSPLLLPPLSPNMHHSPLIYFIRAGIPNQEYWGRIVGKEEIGSSIG